MFKKLGRPRGFHPRRFGPPNAIPPEEVIRHYHLSTGTVREDRHCPLLDLSYVFISSPDKKEIYRALIGRFKFISFFDLLEMIV
jgi:hypothetical protein